MKMTAEIIKTERNEELLIRIEISKCPDSELAYNFTVFDIFYKTDKSGELEKQNWWLKGFVKWDGCINFEFNQEGCLLHSCNMFESLIEKLRWIEKVLEELVSKILATDHNKFKQDE